MRVGWGGGGGEVSKGSARGQLGGLAVAFTPGCRGGTVCVCVCVCGVVVVCVCGGGGSVREWDVQLGRAAGEDKHYI